MAELLHFRVIKEIRVEKHDGDVRFKSGSGTMAVSCTRTAFRHNYRNSSVIVDLTMGQIPRCTERISSFDYGHSWLYHQHTPIITFFSDFQHFSLFKIVDKSTHLCVVAKALNFNRSICVA